MIEDLSFKIKSVSIKGLVTIIFSEPVFEFADHPTASATASATAAAA